MKKLDDLGKRMKGYENCYRVYLPKRSPVVLRIDGRAFHTFTKGFKRPYDEVFARAMWRTAKQLCENIEGAKFAFTESDEISIVLTDYETLNIEPWFGNNLQKLVSISASMATLFFSRNFKEAVDTLCADVRLEEIYNDALEDKMPCFDSRAFVVPRDEVVNYFWWRQVDTKRNSIQLLGQFNFTHSQLQNKSCDEIQEMLWQERGINWANEPNWFKNGVSIYKVPVDIPVYDKEGKLTSKMVTRNKWCIDFETPRFTAEPDYIMQHITFEEK